MRKGIILFLTGVYSATWVIPSFITPLQTIIGNRAVFGGFALFLLGAFLLYLANRSASRNKSYPVKQIFFAVLVFTMGQFMAAGVFEKQQKQWLAKDFEEVSVKLSGEIVSLPQLREKGSRFRLKTVCNKTGKGNCPLGDGVLISLFWRGASSLQPGELWQLEVKLKAPHGLYNPGTFDYEKWLFEQKISARGYVKNSFFNQILYQKPCALNCLRYEIQQLLVKKIKTDDSQGELFKILPGLIIGDRSFMTQRHREVLQNTGTSHLLAISGLHIGLVFFLFYGFLKLLVGKTLLVFLKFRLMPGFDRRININVCILLSAYLAACFYSLLAGFSMPTQRAILMLGVFLLVFSLRTSLRGVDMLLISVLLIVFVEPVNIVSGGLWLSCVAVLIVLWAGVAVMPRQENRELLSLVSFARVQWKVCLLMMVPVLAMFGMVSLVSPLANLVAIPYVSFLLLPASLFLVLLECMFSSISVIADPALNFLLSLLWQVLETLSDSSFAKIFRPVSFSWLILLGLIVVLFPALFFNKYVSLLVFILCILPFAKTRQDDSVIAVHFLDVGQGSSVVLQDGNKALIYDAGPDYEGNFNMGENIILPVLREFGITEVQNIIISHDDDDHWGGALALIKAFPAARLQGSGVRHLQQNERYQECNAGQHWKMGRFTIRVLWPESQSSEQLSDNDSSCVIEARTEGMSVLLSGDIEKEVEKTLVETGRLKPADVFLVPHHGSQTSSSFAFLKSVRPQIAIFSAGYQNHFGHPAKKIAQRYNLLGIKTRSTSECGMVSFLLKDKFSAFRSICWREMNPRIWLKKSS